MEAAVGDPLRSGNYLRSSGTDSPESRNFRCGQAVGGAVGHNPISILIPCHRVVGADGSLTGYAGGVEKKRFLLALEGVDMTNLYMPKRGTAL